MRRYHLKKIILLIVGFTLLLNKMNGQDSYFPITGHNSDDFSSAFGPRNKSEVGQNYPDPGYDYDFHAGVDIGNAPFGTNVYAVLSGTVVNSQSSWITIEATTENYKYYFKYHHLQNVTLDTGDVVTGGSTVVGQVDYDHLDLRFMRKPPDYDYNEWGYASWGANDYDATNPVEMIVPDADLTSPPTILDSDGYLPPIYLTIEEDDRTVHDNQQGKYFQIGVRVEDDELDLSGLAVAMSWEDDSGNGYDAVDLLRISTDPTYPYMSNVVDFDYRVNCGDKSGEDSDVGHISKSVGIYPRIFYRTDPHHTVYFRWYIREDFWNNNNLFNRLDEIKVDISVYDVENNMNIANNVDFVTGTGDPPQNAPEPPTLSSLSYQDTGKVILDWEAPTSGEPADYYRLYRCLNSETISDDDLIGISQLTTYTDDDYYLISTETYKYAVAGVNWAGEGSNSNILDITLPCYTKEVSNRIYMGDKTERGCHFLIKNVEIKSGANVSFEGDDITISRDFEVEQGAEFSIY